MEDEQIIALYWSRDEHAIVETDRKYGTHCRSIAWNILHSEGDSEECVNDTWLRTWNTIPPQRPERLGAFLGKIVRNLAFDRYKAANAQKRGGGEVETVLEELGECVGATASAESHYFAKEFSVAVNLFVRGLPEREGNIFVRRYFFTESADQIGKRYGITVNNVTVILSRSRKKLREYLQKEGYGL